MLRIKQETTSIGTSFFRKFPESENVHTETTSVRENQFLGSPRNVCVCVCGGGGGGESMRGGCAGLGRGKEPDAEVQHGQKIVKWGG